MNTVAAIAAFTAIGMAQADGTGVAVAARGGGGGGAAVDAVVVADAPLVVIAVAWPRGLDDDPPERRGAARALLECRLQRARLAAPRAGTSGGDVDGAIAVAFVAAPAVDGAATVAFVRALLDDALPLADDPIRLGVARAALSADDEAHVLPGFVLARRVRAHCFPASPRASGHAAAAAAARTVPGDGDRDDTLLPGGDPAAIAALSPADVRALLAVPCAPRLAALGAWTPELAAALADVVRDPAPLAPRAPQAPRLDGRALASEVHPRNDAPFVAAAFALAEPFGPAEALAVAVARARAKRSWLPRRNEAAVGAPPVDGVWSRGDRVVTFHRRGCDLKKLLPGERAAATENEVAATAREIERLLADLRERPPAAAELAAAAAAVRADVGVDRAEIAAADARSAGAWLAARLRGAARGIDASALAGVSADAVHAVFVRAGAPERVFWHALVPGPRAGFGYSPR